MINPKLGLSIGLQTRSGCDNRMNCTQQPRNLDGAMVWMKGGIHFSTLLGHTLYDHYTFLYAWTEMICE